MFYSIRQTTTKLCTQSVSIVILLIGMLSLTACDFRGTKGLGVSIRSSSDTTLQNIIIGCRDWISSEKSWTSKPEEVCQDFVTVGIPRHYFYFIDHPDIKRKSDWPDAVTSHVLRLKCIPHCVSLRAPRQEILAPMKGWLFDEDRQPSYEHDNMEVEIGGYTKFPAKQSFKSPFTDTVENSILPGFRQANDYIRDTRSYFIPDSEASPVLRVKCNFQNVHFHCEYLVFVNANDPRCGEEGRICWYRFRITVGDFQKYDDPREYKQIIWNVVVNLCRYMDCDTDDFRERLAAL